MAAAQAVPRPSRNKRNAKALAERRRDEIDFGEAGPAEKPVALDADAARDADGRQRKSATRRSIDAATPDLSAAIAAVAVPPLKAPSSASPVGMAAMIGPEAPRHKASR